MRHFKFKHKKQIYVFLGVVFVLIILIFLGIQKMKIRIEPLTVTELSKRAAVEAAYPEFKNFEFQESFAGKVTMQEEVGSDFYIAYVENGSGLPIVKATCFRVDKDFKVTQIGTFPDPVDSYAGYSSIDVRTCKGIK